ncbi:MAG: hypothetical protein Q8K63_06265, partial [Acidimicrobiales bacterium]|nr:hypothetical protein [Acidimicrobiales bacterium]
MKPLVVFPDVAAAVAAHLDDILDEPIVTRVPNPRPPRFVLVRRVGGPRRDVVTDEATLTLEGWAEGEAEAHDLLQLARAHLHTLSGRNNGVTTYRVAEFAGPASLPDPESSQPRYTMTISVAARGVTPAGS